MDFIKSGQFISELRKERGLTQADLGAILGVGDKTVSKWERGVNIPDILMIREIAKVFNVTADEILAGERDGNELSFIIKAYRNKKLRYSVIGALVFLLIMLLTFLVYFVNNFDKSKIYVFKGNSENHKITGYIYGINNKVRIVLDDLEIKETSEYDNVKIKGYSVKTYLNNNSASNYRIDYNEDDYVYFSNMINEVEKMSFNANNINFDIELKNGYFLIVFIDEDNNMYELKFDFSCAIDLRNNRFFYK